MPRAQNSVESGVRLALEYPREVCVLPQSSAFWPTSDLADVDLLFGEQSAADIESQLLWITDVDGRRKPLFAGNAQYAQHYWWRIAQWRFCAQTYVPNITYIRTVDTVMNHLMRPIFHDVEEGDWPPLPTTPCQRQTSYYSWGVR